jgi:hypothetical protein
MALAVYGLTAVGYPGYPVGSAGSEGFGLLDPNLGFIC